MGKKATKATRKFAASGQLKKTIQQRRKHQDIKRKAERRKGSKKGKEKQPVQDVEEEDHDDQEAAAVDTRCVVSGRYALELIRLQVQRHVCGRLPWWWVP